MSVHDIDSPSCSLLPESKAPMEVETDWKGKHRHHRKEESAKIMNTETREKNVATSQGVVELRMTRRGNTRFREVEVSGGRGPWHGTPNQGAISLWQPSSGNRGINDIGSWITNLGAWQQSGVPPIKKVVR